MCAPREKPVLWDGGKVHYLSEPSLGLLTNVICARPRRGKTVVLPDMPYTGMWEIGHLGGTGH